VTDSGGGDDTYGGGDIAGAFGGRDGYLLFEREWVDLRGWAKGGEAFWEAGLPQ